MNRRRAQAVVPDDLLRSALFNVFFFASTFVLTLALATRRAARRAASDAGCRAAVGAHHGVGARG